MQDNINLDLTDIRMILSHQGRIEGLVGSCKASEIFSSLSENLKLSLKNAKGVLVEFELPNESSLFPIASSMEEISELIGEDTDIIFGTTQNNILEKETIKFKIIVTGIV